MAEPGGDGLDLPVIQTVNAAITPLDAYQQLRHLPYPVLLEGAADHQDLGRWSYVAADPVARITVRAAEWPAIRDRLRAMSGLVVPPPGAPPFVGGWIGWLGYELGAAFDRQPLAPRDQFADSDGELHLHDWVIAWDHLAGTATFLSTGITADGTIDPARATTRAAAVLDLLSATPASGSEYPPPTRGSARTISRSLDRNAYVTAVRRVISDIRAGDIFQANLSQRVVVATAEDPLLLYRRLRELSPASHAALFGGDRGTVVSASPERFLSYDAARRRVESRPIKGTRPRGTTAEADAALAAELLASVKDRAENLMIVDLVRNDLHRVSEPESVAVPELSRLDSHATVHHLVSIVTGRLRHDADGFDLISASFPPGSITGAPKLRAMEILAELEPVARGVYCGAIGWFGLDGSLGLSVAIRTVMIRGGEAALHAGGGVTLLSDPEAEYEESLDKLRAPLAAFGVVL